MGSVTEERILIDVTAADGTLLAHEGQRIDAELFDNARRAGRRAGSTRTTLRGSRVLADLERVTREAAYDRVFHESYRVERLIRLLEGLAAPVPLLDELDRTRDIDGYTYRHVLMTTALSARMLEDLGVSDRGLACGAYAALTHDFGKVKVPLALLHKETPLTEVEARLLWQHTAIGSLLLQYHLGEDGLNARVALTHHERPDGSGYPMHLKLSDRLVRLIAVSDIYDALISSRPYRKQAFDVRGALEFLWAEAKAGRVDEMACRLLVSYNREGNPDPRTLRVSDDIRSPAPTQNVYGTIIKV